MSGFGARCRELRLGFGLTLLQIGELCGYSKQAASQWETDEREPAYDDLLKLADLFGVTTDYLLGRPGAQRDAPAILQAKAALAQYLRLREPDLYGTTAATRLAIVYRFLSETVPGHFARERVANWLRLSTAELDRLIGNNAQATSITTSRFSELSGVPEDWFWIPDPQHYRTLPDAWEPVIKQAKAAGLTPQTTASTLEKALAKEKKKARPSD